MVYRLQYSDKSRKNLAAVRKFILKGRVLTDICISTLETYLAEMVMPCVH